MNIQLCDKYLIYSVLIFRYSNVTSEYSALPSKILKKVKMNISNPEYPFYSMCLFEKNSTDNH